MKISLKLCLAVVALALFGAAIGMFALSFIEYHYVVLNAKNTVLGTGFEIAFKNVEGIKGLPFNESYNVGTLIAFIFVAIGALAACYGVFYALTAKKSKKSKGTAKLICAFCTFVVCGVVPAVLLFVTKQTVINADALEVGLEYNLGIGAILAAVFSILGSCSLAAAELR